MKSWKTSLLGALTIASALITAGISYLTTGHLPDIGPIIAAITAGVGLITAKDSNVTGGSVQQ